jgi:hypothetical protein
MQKIGNQPGELEDSMATNEERSKFAIADGVGESIFPKEWAQILSSHFVCEDFSLFENNAWEDFARHEFLKQAKNAWQEIIPSDLTWYAKDKLADGSFSTLLGVEFRDLRQANGTLSWRAVAIGDSCLFRIGESRTLIQSFPLNESQAFNNFPDLVCSIDETTESSVKRIEGRLEPRECLLLATDSLSKWILKQAEAEGNGLEIVLALPDVEKEAFFVNQVRSGTIKNDDITLLAIENQSS